MKKKIQIDKLTRTMILGLLTFFLIIGYICMNFHDEDTLTIGIFSGSNWEVPGTDHIALFRRAIERFEESHLNVKVTFEEGIPAKYYSEWLTGEVLRGEEPDVFLVLQEDFPMLVEAGVLEGLNGNILKENNFGEAIFYQSTYEAGRRNGMQYAIPFECNPKMMFVNKTLLKKEGIQLPDRNWTWDDFYNICQQVTKDTDGDGKIDQFGFYDYDWRDAMYSNGIQPFDQKKGEGNFTKKRMSDAINFVSKLNDLNENYRVTAHDFDLGNVAFRPLSFSEYRTYMPYPWRIKKYSQFEWNCVTMPMGPSGRNASAMDTLMLGMSSRSIKKKVAWEFLKMMTTDPEIQQYVYENTPGASALKETTCSREVMELLNQDTPGGSEIDMSLLDHVIDQAVIPEYFGNYQEAMQYADNTINQMMKEDEEMNLALFSLNNELRKILQGKKGEAR